MEHVTLKDILTMGKEAKGEIDRIFLHWSAGHYGQFFDDYHFNIDADGNIYAACNSLTERKAHTWRQNTGAVAVSMACCAFATSNDLGDEPPTDAQIEAMSQCVAALCKGLDIPIDKDHVRTHAEQADIDEYGPATTCERWDLWFLKNGEEQGTGGDIIRGKANFYTDSIE